jgi:aryl-alcohol dehydrogenase-like predicted oxidoreductase
LKHRQLGTSDLRVSAAGLGCNNFGVRCDLEQTRATVFKALDLGVTLFDTADNYGRRGGSETLLGEVLGPRRKDIVLATKFSAQMDDEGLKRGASRRYVMEAVEASLTRLRTDWIDLYQLHRPDPLTPIEETLRALDDLMRQGKVRYIGCSNFSGPQLIEAQAVSAASNFHRFISVQNEYSLLNRRAEHEEIPSMIECGVGLLPYAPLASGLLSGKYRRDAIPLDSRLATPRAHEKIYIENVNWSLVEKLDAFAQQRGTTVLELAFGWLLANQVIGSVIAGAVTPVQVEANAAAASYALSAADISELNELTACSSSINASR